MKKNSIVCLILVGLLLSTFLVVNPVGAEDTDYQNISVHDARAMITQNPEIVILDVRNQSEYDMGYLTNAMFVPLYALEDASFGWLQPINGSAVRPNVNDTIIVYCLAGSRSAVACEMLASQGFAHVYNMLGGINAWMSAGYPISTTYHEVAFDVVGNETEVTINPRLLTDCGCPQSGTTSCSDNPDVNTTKLILEDTGNHTVIDMEHSYNGTTRQYTIDKTLLWNYSHVTDQINRTVSFTSVIVTNETGSAQLFSLREDVHKYDSFNMTMLTLLIPLDSETYNVSFTYISYTPVGASRTESMEMVGSNSTMRLSQLYDSLSTVADQLGKAYGKSEDINLHKFESRYADIANEAKIVSQLVKEHLGPYDKNILRSGAIIVDDAWACFVCTLVMSILISGAACAAVIACLPGFGSWICEQIVSYGLGGYRPSYVCEEVFGCWTFGEIPYYYGNTVYDTYTYGTGYIQNANYILGNPDNNGAMMFAGASGDQAMIYVHPNYGSDEYVHGDVQVMARSYTGIYSVLYVYIWNEGTSSWVNVGPPKTINPSGSFSWYDFGYTNICFRNMVFVVYNSGSVSVVYLDAVRITP